MLCAGMSGWLLGAVSVRKIFDDAFQACRTGSFYENNVARANDFGYGRADLLDFREVQNILHSRGARGGCHDPALLANGNEVIDALLGSAPSDLLMRGDTGLAEFTHIAEDCDSAAAARKNLKGIERGLHRVGVRVVGIV